MELLYNIYASFLISIFYSVLALSLPSHPFLPHQGLSNSPSTRNDTSILNTDQSTTKGRTVVKRDWHHYHNLFTAVQHVGAGWSLYWNQLDISHTNVNVVAAQLLDFYTQVLNAAGPTWSSQPPATAHGAFVGDVSIHFHSDAPISWEWIQSFLIAAITQIHASPGDAVVSSYKIAFISAIRTAPIWVELILPWAGPATAA
ncbi:MAG: hypothetical protein Q9225_005008 [Loekoesia sp. 1 TL-2023]